MSLGLLVEGKSDKDAIPKLIRKFLDPSPRIIPRTIHRGEMFNSKKVRPHLEALLKQHQDVEKIIICVDSECTDPEEIREEVSKVERELEGTDLVVKYAVVVHALEGWLATDSRALGRVLGRQVSMERNLEDVCKPDEFLAGLFSRYGKDFQKTRHDPLIAGYADPKRMARLSPSFQRFCETLGDP